jgi:1-acyl-sn-glycerol-3-phosphate acyltransferase
MGLKNKLCYEAARLCVGPFFSWHYRVKGEGTENVPEEGGALIVCNHRSLLDPALLMWEVDRFINFAAASYSFKIPGSAQLYSMMGAFPISISGGEGAERGLKKALDLLKGGELVAIFPEGVESFVNPDRVRKIHEFKTGFVRVAWEARVPIIPAAVAALEERKLPRIPGFLVEPFFPHEKAGEGMAFITYRHARVRIGKPLSLEELYDREPTKLEIDRISGKIRRIVEKLFNGEDLDRFMYGEEPFDLLRDRV